MIKNLVRKCDQKLLPQFVKVRKLKSLRTQVPIVRRPKPATNIIKAATLYLVASVPLLNKKVSEAKEFDCGIIFWRFFFLDVENIYLTKHLLIN